MKKTVRFLTALLLVNLCGVLPGAASAHISPNQLSQVQWQDVPFSETLKTTLSERQKQSFTASFAGIESPVAAYRIPAGQGTLTLEISSPVLDDRLFVPSAMVFDANFNSAASYPSSEFKFYEERGMQPNRLAAELSLTPTANQDYIYLLIYTTAQDLNGSTMVPHPAKTYAKATGKAPPALNDIEVRHSLNGQINLNVSNSGGTRFIGLPALVFSSKNAGKNTNAQSAPANTAAAVVRNDIQSGNSKAVNTPVDKDTEAYFNQAVSKALKANDINKALNLVNEAEKLGLTSPRRIFLQQVSSK